MKDEKTTFALFFGNRGVFPASLMASAREELPKALEKMGHKSIMLDTEATRYGAVETPQEGELYAKFLHENKGKFGGVIVSLPNFGDENGAVQALQEADVPIFVQAYPDEMDKMAPDVRRDSFCGKFSIMDVFYQCGIKATVLEPHTVHPAEGAFEENIAYFDRVCRVVNALRGMRIGAVGARVTAFKTVRIDEVALQRHGITVESFDLSDTFDRVAKKEAGTAAYKEKADILRAGTSWKNVPDEAFDKHVKAALVFDDYVAEYNLDALAIRCWNEFESVLGVAPCVLLGELNDRLVAAACEVDIGNAVMMQAFNSASYAPATCLDWNNNYKDERDKCILFHCGPVPPQLMTPGTGHITTHDIIKNEVEESRTFGCNQGRLAPNAISFGSMMTWDGKPRFYLGEGVITDDPIPSEFFGCAGVAHIERLQEVLLYIGRNGYRHHVSVTPGHIIEPVREALEYYMGLEAAVPQGM